MLTFLIAFAVISVVLILTDDYGDVLGLIIGAVFAAVFVSFCTTLFWAGSQAHYTDIATPIKTQVINGEAQLTFTDINNKMYVLPATAVISRVCERDQVVTYTATQPTWKWTVFPSLSPDHSHQPTVICVSAK